MAQEEDLEKLEDRFWGSWFGGQGSLLEVLTVGLVYSIILMMLCFFAWCPSVVLALETTNMTNSDLVSS